VGWMAVGGPIASSCCRVAVGKVDLATCGSVAGSFLCSATLVLAGNLQVGGALASKLHQLRIPLLTNTSTYYRSLPQISKNGAD